LGSVRVRGGDEAPPSISNHLKTCQTGYVQSLAVAPQSRDYGEAGKPTAGRLLRTADGDQTEWKTRLSQRIASRFTEAAIVARRARNLRSASGPRPSRGGGTTARQAPPSIRSPGMINYRLFLGKSKLWHRDFARLRPASGGQGASKIAGYERLNAIAAEVTRLYSGSHLRTGSSRRLLRSNCTFPAIRVSSRAGLPSTRGGASRSARRRRRGGSGAPGSSPKSVSRRRPACRGFSEREQAPCLRADGDQTEWKTRLSQRIAARFTEAAIVARRARNLRSVPGPRPSRGGGTTARQAPPSIRSPA
jgi:hypothetical protein